MSTIISMSDLAGAASSSYLTWFMPFMACFGSCFRGERHSGKYPFTARGLFHQRLIAKATEKHLSLVVDSQPSLHSTTISAPKSIAEQGQWKAKAARKSSASGRTSNSARSWLWSEGLSSRPMISAPSGFRHLNSGAPQFPPEMYETPAAGQLRPAFRTRDDSARSRREGQYFRPLELSIYAPSRRISPLLPHFEFPRIATPPPPPAYCAEGTNHEDRQLVHQHSFSSMSFHVPRRRPVMAATPCNGDESPPIIPPKSRNRPRAYTAPEVDAIKERVASALIEVEKLQKQIDDVIERQSVYVNSRPSTSHSIARTMPGTLFLPLPLSPILEH